MGGEDQNKTCVLSDNDIRRLKFKETGVSPDVKYLTNKSSKKMNLRIEKTNEEGYTDNKKYILSSVDSDILINSTFELKEGVVVADEFKKLKTKTPLLIEKGKRKYSKAKTINWLRLKIYK